MFKITLDGTGKECFREETDLVPQCGFEKREDGNFYKQLLDPRCITDFIKRQAILQAALTKPIPTPPVQRPQSVDVTYTKPTGLQKVMGYLCGSNNNDVMKHQLGSVDMGSTKIIKSEFSMDLNVFLRHLINYSSKADEILYEYYNPEMSGHTFRILDSWTKYALITCNVKTKAIRVWIHDSKKHSPDIIILNALT